MQNPPQMTLNSLDVVKALDDMLTNQKFTGWGRARDKQCRPYMDSIHVQCTLYMFTLATGNFQVWRLLLFFFVLQKRVKILLQTVHSEHFSCFFILVKHEKDMRDVMHREFR